MKHKARRLLFSIILFYLSIFIYGEIKIGNFSGEIKIDGFNRYFIFHMPGTIQKGKIPLLIALHGGWGTPSIMRKHSHFDEISDREGFIVLYPEGYKRHWNDGRNVKFYFSHRKGLNDVKFISKLIDFFVKKYNVDRKKVYVAGMSNGALMAFRLACEIPEKIAAIASVSGSMTKWVFNHCKSNLPVSVLMINGTNDPLIKWNGGEIKFKGFSLGKVVSVKECVEFWIKRDMCDIKFPKRWLKDKDLSDGVRVWLERYLNSKSGVEVVLYGIKGGGHSWPGENQYFPTALVGKTCKDINASKIIWQFFKRHEK